MPTKELAIISARPGSSPIKELIGQHLVRLAELIRKDGAPYPLTPQLVNVWVDVFERANLKPEQVEAAFHKAERACKFWPSPADVLGFVTTAKSNAVEEEAATKWTKVLDYAVRLSPDYADKNPPRISEQVRRAIAAAGGLTFIRECDSESLPWARKRFIETYLRIEDLQRNEDFLPEGALSNLLADGNEKKLLPTDAYETARALGLAEAEKSKELRVSEPDMRRAVAAIQAVMRGSTPRPPVRSLDEQKRILRERGLLPAT